MAAPSLEESERRADLMRRLMGLGDSLSRQATVLRAAQAIVEGAITLSGAERAALYVRAADGTVTCPHASGLPPEYVAAIATPKGTNPWAHAARHPELVHMSAPKGGGGPAQAAAPEPSLVPDVRRLSQDASAYRSALQAGVLALGTWPLLSKGRVIGAFTCYYTRAHDWTAPEREVMQAFAAQAAAALESAQAFEAQGQRTAELEALFEIGRRLRTAPTLGDAYAALADHTMRLLRAHSCVVAILDHEARTLSRVHVAGAPLPDGPDEVPVTGSLSGRALSARAPYRTDDLARDAEYRRGPAACEPFPALGPFVLVPLQSEQGPIGTLALGRSLTPDARPFTEAEVRLLEGVSELAGTAIRRGLLFENLEQSYIQIVFALAQANDLRDAYTAGHSERVSGWVEAVARGLGCRDAEVRQIRWAALLHDIGKLGTPDAILRKPGRLTDAEFTEMRQHPAAGEKILTPVERMRPVAKIVRHHHERWDGTGYPDGLRGDAIPLGARVLSVVDAYSAMVDERPYKSARPPAEAIEELQRCAGTHFDPRVVEVFCQVLARQPA